MANKGVTVKTKIVAPPRIPPLPTQDSPMYKGKKGKTTVTKGPFGGGNGSGNTYN